MASKIALVIGAGPNIGAATIKTFKENAYKVAFASRSADSSGNNDTTLALKVDLSKPSTVSEVFAKVRQAWGEPRVVVYNAAAHFSTEPSSSLDIPTEAFEQQLAINTTSVFVAAREAVAGFKKLDGPKTFLYTGNATNEGALAGFLCLGVGKNASAHLIELADKAYKDQEIRFHYVDQRKEDGKPMFTGLSGQGHADFFLSVAERKGGEVPWQATFVEGKGYKAFPHELIL